MEQRFAKWDEYLKTICEEIQELVANQHTFLKVWSMVDRNPKIQRPNSFYKFLYDAYAAYSTSAVRRQIKSEKNRKRKYNISFVELLEEIIETPEVLSRKRFTALVNPGYFLMTQISQSNRGNKNEIRIDLRNLLYLYSLVACTQH